jgi:hypothetical protein
VAQLGSAPAWGTGGRWFESSHPDVVRRRNSPLVLVIKRYRVAWGWVTVGLYVVAVPFTIVVFPANSLWLGLLVLFSGFTASLATLADLLVNAEESQASDNTNE